MLYDYGYGYGYGESSVFRSLFDYIYYVSSSFPMFLSLRFGFVKVFLTYLSASIRNSFDYLKLTPDERMAVNSTSSPVNDNS